MKLLAILLSFAALSWAQDPPECMCGAFVSALHGEYEVRRFPNILVESCDDEKLCASTCADEWKLFTNGGDLDAVWINGYTVGQEFCNSMASHGRPNLAPHSVYAYYNICFGPWMFDGQTSQQMLCCQDGVYPGNCGAAVEHFGTQRM